MTKYMTLKEAAIRFAMSKYQLRTHIIAGRLRAIQLVPNGKWLVPEDAELVPMRREVMVADSCDVDKRGADGHWYR